MYLIYFLIPFQLFMVDKNNFPLFGTWELQSIEMYTDNSLSGSNEIYSPITYNFIPHTISPINNTGSLHITEEGQTTSNEFEFSNHLLSINKIDTFNIEVHSDNEFLMYNHFDNYKMVYKFIRIKNELTDLD